MPPTSRTETSQITTSRSASCLEEAKHVHRPRKRPSALSFTAPPLRFLRACGPRTPLYARSGLRFYIRAGFAREIRACAAPACVLVRHARHPEGGSRGVSGRCCIGRELVERGEPARGARRCGEAKWAPCAREQLGPIAAALTMHANNERRVADVVNSESEYKPFSPHPPHAQ